MWESKCFVSLIIYTITGNMKPSRVIDRFIFAPPNGLQQTIYAIKFQKNSLENPYIPWLL